MNQEEIHSHMPPTRREGYQKSGKVTTGFSVSSRPQHMLKAMALHIGRKFNLSNSRVVLWAVRVLYRRLVSMGELESDENLERSLRRD